MPAETNAPLLRDEPTATAADVPDAPQRLSDRVLAMADQHRRWLLALTLLLYIAGFNAQWRLEPDSALYLSIGRNLVEGHGYTFHGKDHRLAYPGVPMLFAALFKAFGTGSLLPHLAVMWLMGLATLALVYRLFLLHAGRPTAVLITFGVAISRIFYRYTFELLTDLPFLFGVVAFFVGYEAIFYRRNGTEAAGPRRRGPGLWLDGILMLIGLAVAVSTRPSMLALMLAAGLSAIWALLRGRARWGHLLVMGIVVLAVALFYVKDPRHEPSDPAAAVSTTYAEEDELFKLNASSLRQYAAKAAGNVVEVLNGAVVKASFGLPVVPGLNMLLSLVVLTSGVLLVRVRPLWGMWVLATLAMVLVIPKPLDRYFLPTVPILVFAWWTFVCWVERCFSGPAARWAFLILFGFGGACNLFATADFIVENRRMPFLAHYKDGRYASVYDVAKMIEDHTAPSGAVTDKQTTWVLVPDKFGRILTFLSRRYCIEPGRYSALDPRVQNVYVLNPMVPKEPDANDLRQPTPLWLQSRGAVLKPEPLAKVPNKDPDDDRPFTLHDAVPVEELVNPQTPAAAPPATGSAPSD